MKYDGAKFGCFCLLLCALIHCDAWSMTIQLGSGDGELVAAGDTWTFFRGAEPPSDPADAWKEPGFDDSAWETGSSGFGYGDDDDATVLDDMQDGYVTVYIRKEFSVSSVPPDASVQLVIDYDDGFIAYLNGQEVARRNMPAGEATYETAASSHEAGTPETIVLGSAGNLLNEGANLLAVEGHNTSSDSSDFSLAPALQTASDVVRNGQTWIVSRATVRLRGATDAPDAVSVMIGETAADFNPGDGAWQADVSLAPGLNTLTAQALDADANVVDSGSIQIAYVPPANVVGSELPQNATWSGACIVQETVVVPAGMTLTIEPGAMVLLKDGVSLVVRGQLLAEGTEAHPIRFTHYGDGRTWKQIMFAGAADSRLAHCVIEFADSEGEHQDYYEPGPRDYHEAVVVVASHVDFEHCLFRNLPDDGGNAEGDAIAVISDDQDYPGDAAANVRGCQFLSIGQGVHARYSYVLVENCFFTDKHGDNDDVDLWGESTPAPVIRNNLFLNPAHDDMINPTRCSAVITGNVIIGSDDHGVVLRDRCFPVMKNNLILNCSSAGIAVENSCEALLVNNTIVNCGRGVRHLDLGRWGPPYNLNPGGGTSTIINCIIRDCGTPITLADSSNTEIEDRGSHVTVLYSNIEGGRGGVSVDGSRSTLTWGPGNVDVDPLFTDPDNDDYHLKSQAGRWDATAQDWVRDDQTSPCIDAGDPTGPIGPEPFPNGGLVNMGVYGATVEASKSYFGEPPCETIITGDINGDCRIDYADFAIMALHWLEDRAP